MLMAKAKVEDIVNGNLTVSEPLHKWLTYAELCLYQLNNFFN